MGVASFRAVPMIGSGSAPYWLKESNDLKISREALLRDEVGLEAFYNFAITPYVQLSFDAQWISSGNPVK